MNKQVPVVTVAAPEAAARLEGLPLEASIALADVAGAIREGLLAFPGAVGLVVMRQMMDAELTASVSRALRPTAAAAEGRQRWTRLGRTFLVTSRLSRCR